MNNIHPIFDRMVHRAERERRMGQRSRVFWFTGLSGSGKSTLAVAVERLLFGNGYHALVLDGDNIRSGISNNLTFSEPDRIENIRRIAEVSKLFVQAGIITLNCFISPTRAMRQMAAEIIGGENFMEIYVNTPLEVCEERDVKGLYSRARKGEIRDFTGIDASFEAPERPAFTIDTTEMTIEDSTAAVLQFIIPNIQYT
jgi:adenylylsulfate kinase